MGLEAIAVFLVLFVFEYPSGEGRSERGVYADRNHAAGIFAVAGFFRTDASLRAVRDL